MATAVLFGARWGVDELKDLIREFSAAVTHRLDDHDLLIELKTTQQHTLNQVNALISEVPKRYVTTDQFEPVKKIVYALVALMLTSIGGAILSLAIRKS